MIRCHSEARMNVRCAVAHRLGKILVGQMGHVSTPSLGRGGNRLDHVARKSKRTKQEPKYPTAGRVGSPSADRRAAYRPADIADPDKRITDPEGRFLPRRFVGSS